MLPKVTSSSSSASGFVTFFAEAPWLLRGFFFALASSSSLLASCSLSDSSSAFFGLLRFFTESVGSRVSSATADLRLVLGLLVSVDLRGPPLLTLRLFSQYLLMRSCALLEWISSLFESNYARKDQIRCIIFVNPAVILRGITFPFHKIAIFALRRVNIPRVETR